MKTIKGRLVEGEAGREGGWDEAEDGKEDGERNEGEGCKEKERKTA